MLVAVTFIKVSSFLSVLAMCPAGIFTFPVKSTVAFLLASVSGSCVIAHVTALFANPVVSTTAVNCTGTPALTDTSCGFTFTLVTDGVSVVKTTAPLKRRS